MDTRRTLRERNNYYYGRLWNCIFLAEQSNTNCRRRTLIFGIMNNSDKGEDLCAILRGHGYAEDS